MAAKSKTTKDKTKMSPLQLLRALVRTSRLALRSNRRAMLAISFVQLVSGVLPAVNALVAGLVVSALATSIGSGDMGPFVWWLAVSLAINVANFGLNAVISYLDLYIRYDIEAYAGGLLYRKYTGIPMAERENKEFADSFERAENYVSELPWLWNRFVSMMANVIAFVAAFVAMTTVSFLLALIVALVSIPYFLLDYRQTRREREQWMNNSIYRRKAWRVKESIVNPRQAVELRLNGLNDYFVKKWRWLHTRDRKSQMAIEKSFLAPKIAISSLDSIVGAGVLVWVGHQIIRGVSPIGQFVSFQALMGNLSNSGRGVLTDLNLLSRELLNSADFFKIMDSTIPARGSKHLTENGRPPKIELRDVTFTYPLADRPAIKNISLILNPGEDVALVGENGSGKTTLIKLLTGIYTPDSGQILIDDIPLEQLDINDWHVRLGALFQDYSRYEFASLKENIWYGDIKKKPLNMALQAALDKAKLGDLPGKLDKGFEQILSKDFDKDSGTDLSGGQWQRLALARGFFRAADVLILDEPTAAVDAKAEYEIFREIATTQTGKTTIIISHRFSTVRRAQRIYVISDGAIVASGTHSELMRQKGLYHEMFTLQAEGYQ
jgi:ATP-binding cassette subfamily B protein/ATP-binding cassette subfamily C protein